MRHVKNDGKLLEFVTLTVEALKSRGVTYEDMIRFAAMADSRDITKQGFVVTHMPDSMKSTYKLWEDRFHSINYHLQGFFDDAGFLAIDEAIGMTKYTFHSLNSDPNAFNGEQLNVVDCTRFIDLFKSVALARKYEVARNDSRFPADVGEILADAIISKALLGSNRNRLTIMFMLPTIKGLNGSDELQINACLSDTNLNRIMQIKGMNTPNTRIHKCEINSPGERARNLEVAYYRDPSEGVYSDKLEGFFNSFRAAKTITDLTTKKALSVA